MSQLTGDWDKLLKMLEDAGNKAKTEIQKATNLNGRLLEATMVHHIENQDLDWPALSPKYARFKELHGFPAEMLELTLSLLSNIRYHSESATWDAGFVGILRGTQGKGKDGKPVDVCNVAAVMENGTEDGRVPARPFVAPTQVECEPKMAQNYQDAIDRVFKA